MNKQYIMGILSGMIVGALFIVSCVLIGKIVSYLEERQTRHEKVVGIVAKWCDTYIRDVLGVDKSWRVDINGCLSNLDLP